jgi:hypothetical protein
VVAVSLGRESRDAQECNDFHEVLLYCERSEPPASAKFPLAPHFDLQWVHILGPPAR